MALTIRAVVTAPAPLTFGHLRSSQTPRRLPAVSAAILAPACCTGPSRLLSANPSFVNSRLHQLHIGSHPHHTKTLAYRTRGSSFRRAMTTQATVTFQTELELACNAVKLASTLCQNVQRVLLDDDKQDKSDDSPVTVADYGAQAVVAWSLCRASPDRLLSMVAEEDSEDLQGEENAGIRAKITQLVSETVGESLSEKEVLALIDLGNSEGGPDGTHWVLDPIDGTRGFVGGRQYAVCLGMIKDGEVVVGSLGCPNLPVAPLTDEDGTSAASGRIGAPGYGVCFAASKGGGSFAGPLTEPSIPTQAISVSDDMDSSKMRFMESYESRHSSQSETSALADKIGITASPLRLDSQCKYGALSRGDAAVFMRFPPPSYREKIWDHAAGVLIVKEAGAKVTDASGAELDFSRGRWLDFDRGIIAAPPKLHAKLVEACRK